MAVHPLLLLFIGLLGAVAGVMIGRLWERWEQRQMRAEHPPENHQHGLPTPLLDPVTQLPNPAAMLEALARQLSFADRLKHPVTVLIAEVDDYGELLAQRGEAGAQQVLQEVARRLKFRVRTHEILGRWDPSHFLVVLPDVDVGNALVLAEDLRECISAQPMVLAGHDEPVGVTISIGVHGRTPTKSRPLRDLAAEMVVGAERALEATVAGGPNRLEIEP